MHRFILEIPAHHFLRLAVESADQSLLLSLTAPDGQKIYQIDHRADDRVFISLAEEVSGRYRLDVQSRETSLMVKPYRIIVEASRMARAFDRNVALGDKADLEGAELCSQWKGDSLQKAIHKYESAFKLWKGAGYLKDAAHALRRIGQIYSTLSDNRKALYYYNQSLRLSRELSDDSGKIASLDGISLAFVDLGHGEKAQRYAAEAQELSGRINDSAGEASSLNNLGLAHYIQSDFEQAIRLLERSLQSYEHLKDRQGQSRVLLNLGYTYYDLGDLERASTYYSRSLDLSRATKDLHGQAQALTALAAVYSFHGEKQKALEHHHRAEQLFEAIGDKNGQAATLNGIGYVYDDLGEKESALNFYKRAMHLYQRAGNRLYQALTIGYIGRVYDALNNLTAALDCYKRRLELLSLLGDRRMEAYTLQDIAKILREQGRLQQARQYLAQCLSVFRRLKDRRGQAYTLNDLGNTYIVLGQPQEAFTCFGQALSLIKDAGDRTGEITTLYNLARAKSNLNDLLAARRYAEEAIHLIESLTGRISSQSVRTSYFASLHGNYELYIDLLMRMQKSSPLERLDIRAFEANEHARGRTLLETLVESHVDIYRDIDPSLLEQERLLRQKINSKTDEKMRLANGDKKGLDAINQELDGLLIQDEELEAEFRSKTPAYVNLTRPQPLHLDDIQKSILDAETLLLEFSLGEQRSFLWVVTQASLIGYELPKRAVIEDAARRLLNLISEYQPSHDQAARRSPRSFEDIDRDFQTVAAQLSQMLLHPVAAELGAKRLLIVADGILQYLPFSAFPAPPLPQEEAKKEAAVSQNSEPLVVRHEIITLPSASVLAVLRQQPSKPMPNNGAIAIFADPVFDSKDSRVRQPASPTANSTTSRAAARIQASGAHQAKEKFSGVELPRLSSTEREAENIMAVIPPEQAMLATGFKASLATLASPEVSQSRILHFATHSVIDAEHPELSAIVLSLVDDQGNRQDGFLRLRNIYNLELSAEMIVLSACNTALGKDVKGEGMIGIVRGFMYAGAKRVVATLWQVDDAASTELISRFYEKMLKENMKPAAALRSAQIEMWKQRAWATPYYWAGFIIQGDWQ